MADIPSVDWVNPAPVFTKSGKQTENYHNYAPVARKQPPATTLKQKISETPWITPMSYIERPMPTKLSQSASEYAKWCPNIRLPSMFGHMSRRFVWISFFFGSISSNVGASFTVPFASVSSLYPGLDNAADAQVLGIPTYAFIDATLDSAAVTEVTAYTYPNLYFKNTSNGKVHPNGGDSIRTLDEMVYWSLQGASRSWWASDLRAIRTTYTTRLQSNGCTATNIGAPNYQLSGCSSGFAGFAYP